MPGIHVRGVGKSNKTRELQRLPTLNVPGSYWLSHRQNIYKFTFKYRETTRETEEFSYKNELLGVIRRIIKYPSSQGQLDSIHLSITYKHTFWTRQDKMFAMLKFHKKERSADFSQAFILTISRKGSTDSNEQISSAITQADSNSCSNGGVTLEPFMNSPHLDSRMSSDQDTAQEVENKSNSTKLHPSSNFENNLVNAESTTTTTTVEIDSSIGLKDSTDIGADEPKSLREGVTEQSEGKMQRKDGRMSLPSEMQRFDNLKNVVISEHDKSPRAVDTHRDSDCREHLRDSISANVETATGKRQIENVVVGCEPIIPRSSDITDQVMEGLMFTIKQDKDNIKVVEQRTKMELDEVLENSEKIETKEGEKCLVNSSLLGLENLLTKIDVPNKQHQDKQTNSALKINEKISYAHMLFGDHDRVFTSGFSSFQPREQGTTPISFTNRIPALSSLESNGNDHGLGAPTNVLVPVQLPKVKTPRIYGDQVVIEKFNQNVIERKRRKLVLGGVNSGINRQPEGIVKREIVNNRTNISNGTAEENNSYADNNVGNGNNDNNNNNNNSNINSNNNSNGTGNIIAGEVQIDMWKLLQDIARGVKVMVERISDTDIKNATRSQTISASAIDTTMARRIPTRSTK